MRELVRLSLGLFAVQAGFHGFTASLPVALDSVGVMDQDIGLVVGFGALTQIPAAFLVGGLIDRLGNQVVFRLGGLAFLASCLLLVPSWSADSMPLAILLLARGIQGFGAVATLASALTEVPRLVPAGRQGQGLAVVGTAQVMAMMLMPPLSLAILSAYSLTVVAIAMAGFVVVGLVLGSVPLPRRPIRTPPVALEPAPLRSEVDLVPSSVRSSFSIRRMWAAPLVINVAFMVHWGVIVALLPQRAEASGADIGLFFVADGLALLASRIPAGWLTDRMPAAPLVVVGLAVTALVIGGLTLTPRSTELVLLAVVSAAAGALVFTPTLVELARRSDASDRGMAFALYSASLAAGIAIGAVGGGALVRTLGFEVTLLATIGGLIVAGIVAVHDPRMWWRPRGGPA